jgi:Ca2+-binding RTX toxin-like protein
MSHPTWLSRVNRSCRRFARKLAQRQHQQYQRKSLRRFLFEHLEDRRLLSVTPLSPQEIAAFRDTASAIDGFGAKLQDFSSLSKQLPYQTTTIGDFVDIQGDFKESFVTPILNYLNPSSRPTREGLKAAVDQSLVDLTSQGKVSGAQSVELIADSTLLSYKIDAIYHRSVDVTYDLANAVSADQIAIDGKLAAKLNFDFHFNITLGIDLTKASTVAGAFVGFGTNTITASMTATTPTPITANVGFLGVTLENPTAILNLNLSFDTTTPTKKVLISEISAPDLTNFLTVTTTGANNFSLNLAIKADLLGLEAASASLAINDANLFDTIQPTVDVNAAAFADFRTLSASSFFNGLQQVQNTLGGIDAFDTEIPFTGGKTLSDVLNLGVAIGSKVTGPAADPKDGKSPGFKNAQGFGKQVADRVQYVPMVSGQVNGASKTTPIKITTTSTNGLVNGQRVFIAGVKGNEAANGTFYARVADTDTTTFELYTNPQLTAGVTGTTDFISSTGTWKNLSAPSELLFDVSFDHNFNIATFPMEFGVGLGDLSIETPPVLSGKVTGASNAKPVVITTETTLGLVDGHKVSISGVDGNTAANGTFYAKVLPGGTTFALYTDANLTTAVDGVLKGAFSGGNGSWRDLTDVKSKIDIDADLKGAFEIGVVLAQPGSTFGFGDSTRLSDLNGGVGVKSVMGNDLKITLRDGSTANIDITDTMTVGDLIGALKPTTFGTKLLVQYDTRKDLITGGTFNQGLVLLDRSTPTTSTSVLKVEMLNQSLAGAVLGLIGTGREGVLVDAKGDVDKTSYGLQTGKLHGQSIGDNVFIRPKSGESMFTATASLKADIAGTAHLGFIDVGLHDGKAIGSLSASFTPSTTKTYGRITALAPKAPTFPTPLTGNVSVVLNKADGTLLKNITIPLGAGTFATTSVEALATAMNASLTSADAKLVSVSSSSGKLTFLRKDGVNGSMIVKSDTVSKKLGINSDLTNNRIIGAEVSDLISDAKLKLRSSKPVTFGQPTKSGTVKIEVIKEDGSKANIDIPFTVVSASFDPSSANTINLTNNTISITGHGLKTGDRVKYDAKGNTAIGGLTDGTSYYVIKNDVNTIRLATKFVSAIAGSAIDLTAKGSGTTQALSANSIDDLTAAMNRTLSTANASLIKVGSSGDVLTFTLNDGVGRKMTVKSNTDLGINSDLSAYIASPKLKASAHFKLPFKVTLGFGDFTLPDVHRTITFDIPDLTADNFSLPQNLNFDLGSLGGGLSDQLKRLKKLDMATVISSLVSAFNLLKDVFRDSPLFNQQLPLLNTDLNSIIDIADVFGDIVTKIQANPASGLGQLDEIFEDLVGLPENVNGNATLPSFPVSMFPLLNKDRVFGSSSIKLDKPDEFPKGTGQLFNGVTYYTLDSFLHALQADVPEFGLKLDTTKPTSALRIDLPFDIGQQFGIQNQVAPLQFKEPISIDMKSFGIDGLSSFVDARADATVSAQALGRIKLAIGIELPDNAPPRPFLYDGTTNGTSLELLVRAAASPVNFEVAIGPIGASLKDGDLRIGAGPIGGARFNPTSAVILTANTITYANHGFITGDRVEYSNNGGVIIGGVEDGKSYYVIKTDANTIKLASSDANATAGTAIDLTSAVDGTQMHRLLGSLRFAVGIADNNGDGRHYFNEIMTTVQNGLELKDFTFAGGVDATFNANLAFEGLGFADFPLSVELHDTTLTDGKIDSFTVEINGLSAKEAIAPVRNAMNDGKFNVLALVGGWNGAFDLMIDAMEGQVFGIELPFIGDKLKDQASFLRNIKDSVSANFSDNSKNVKDGKFSSPFQDVRQDLLDAIGPNGIKLLKDKTGDGQVTIDDIVIKQLNPGIGFEILLGSNLAKLDLPIDFDLGIPGLSLDINANVTGELGFDLGLSFGVDLANGFFIDTRDSFLNVFVDVGVPGLSATGELAFLRLNADEVLASAVAVLGAGDNTKKSQLKISSVAVGGVANFNVKIIQDNSLIANQETATYDAGTSTLTLTINQAVTTAGGLVNRINNTAGLSSQFVASKLGDGTGLVSATQKVVGTSKSSAVALIGKNQPTDAQFKLFSNDSGSTANFDVRIVQKAPSDTAAYAFSPLDRLLTFRVDANSTANNIVELVNINPELTKLFTAVAVGTGTGLVKAQRAVGVSNSFAGRFDVDILDPGQNDGLLTLSEILQVRSYKDVIKVSATAVAGLDLHLLASFAGQSSFPSIQTDLGVYWSFALGQKLQLPAVEFTDIQLDLGSFFSGFAKSIFDEVDKILKPVRPIIDFLTEPLPVVSDLAGGDITMLDLLRLQGGTVEKAVKFIEAIRDLDNIIQSIPDLGAGNLLNMGGAIFDPITKTLTATGTAADVKAAISNLTKNVTKPGFDITKFTQSETDLAATPDDKLKLGFPLLDPKNVMGLLSGKIIDLFTLKLPILELEKGIKRFFPLPILPMVGVELAGSVSARAEFAFGFDTAGIKEFTKSGDVEDIFNGFYVFDRAFDNGDDDINEVVLKAQVTAAAALDAGIIKASVGGGLFATIDFNLHDNNNDGKIRLVELLDNTLLGTKDGFGPIHIFDVGGKLDAGLFAEITVGVGPLSYTKHFDLANVTLFEFTFPRPTGEGVQLAQMVGGSNSEQTNHGDADHGTTLQLNIGENAHLRNFLFTDDVAEDYNIYTGSAPGSVVVEAFGRSQIYTGVTRIVGNAGQGNDKIVISKDITIPVELHGGAGNDLLIGGSGNDALYGDAGDDDLRGGLGNDSLDGGTDRDSVRGDAGDDVLRGGSEDDQLDGGDHKDTIYGDGGNDLIHGRGGDDVVFAGAGFDVVYGDGGGDELHGDNGQGGGDDGDLIEGGDGSDTVFGGGGDDRLYGNDGNDVIHGGTGNDVVYGGVGNDTIYGDGDNDQLFGENSRDIIYGGAGHDLLEGGLASDDLYGGTGNDRLFFNTSDTTQVDDASHVLVGGSGDDLIYASTSPIELLLNTIFGDGINNETGAVDNTTDGNDEIYGSAGKDTIYAGGGNDLVNSLGNDDFIDAGSGDDKVYAGAGNDFVIGGFGNDQLYAEAGQDVLWGGTSTDTDLTKFNLSIPSNFELPPRFSVTQAAYPTAYFPAINVTPKFVAGLSIPGVEGDGRDVLEGGADSDLLFGGADADVIHGGDDPDYIDAGTGDDVNVNGDAGDDVIRGGGNNDVLHGGTGIDQILGDGGDDQLFGDEGTGTNQIGQRLYGGDGGDTLFAYAPTTLSTESVLAGDQLFGDADGDTLNGNIRKELFVGGGGDDLLRGDYLKGPTYTTNPLADQTGADDAMFGDGGEDKLFGGGGNDTMWGGPDTDYFDGQKGDDVEYGGSGNDLFVVSAMMINASGGQIQAGIDTINGHYGNSIAGDSADDSTDVLIINGSGLHDTIGLSQLKTTKQLRINFTPGAFLNLPINVNWLDATGQPLIEQFQIAGLGGDDLIGFAGVHPLLLPLLDAGNTEKLDLSKLTARSKVDMVATIEGNSGIDTIIGSSGRDRISGGPGSDTIYGFAGDDKLMGDNKDGFQTDVDTLYGGHGNDDLTGGQGSNKLYAWSLDPKPTGFTNFGIFVDDQGNLFPGNSLGGTLKAEVTGLNRVLGNIRNDELFGGTTLDFMYGRGGNDTLYRADGTKFESMGGVAAGDEWKAYAKETDQVWYIGGTNADDDIRVDFVTEPGLLSDHHLITRSTNNNGNFTFSAQVRLDFTATDSDGNGLWSPNDLIADYEALRNIKSNATLTDLMKVDYAKHETNLINSLLPPEGDFQAIIIDALSGNDKVTVGPTVQKSVWIDGGAGDDDIRILGGNAILVDKAETGKVNGTLARNDTAAQAFALTSPVFGSITGATFDPNFQLPIVVTTSANHGLSNGQLIAISGVNGNTNLNGAAYYVKVLTPTTFSLFADALLSVPKIGNSVYTSGGTWTTTTWKGFDGTASKPDGLSFTGLTMDNSADVDWFSFQLAANALALGKLELQSGSPIDTLELAIYDSSIIPLTPLNAGTFVTSGSTSSISLNGLLTAKTYLLKVTTPNIVPTIYDLRFNLTGTTAANLLAAIPEVNLGVRGDSERRDIILGGTGDDILMGGPGEDWILGGTGNDVISGGLDRMSGDLLLGDEGDDTFQIIPDRLPLLGNQPKTLFDPVAKTFRPTANDEIDGGPGNDRMLYVGGNLDRRGFAVPDFAALRYNTGFQRYEFSSLVWDIGQQKFMADPVGPDTYVRQYLFYQTSGVENTQIELQEGDDTFHADPSYLFPGSVGPEEWGIKLGNYQQGATEAQLNIAGGNGVDELYGGALADKISGGPGNDIIFGSQGNDDLQGDGGNDKIFGLKDTSAQYRIAQSLITDATLANPIVITTSSTVGLTSGQAITITGVLGNTNANGTFYLKVLGLTTFSLYTDAALTIGKVGNVLYSGGGTWTTMRSPGQVVAQASFGSSEAYKYDMVAPFFALPTEATRKGIDLSALTLKPVVHYSFDSATNLGLDDSRRGNNGVLAGVTYAGGGISGGSARFDNNTSILTIGTTGVDLGSSWTVSAWFKNLTLVGTTPTLFANHLTDRQILSTNVTNHLGVFEPTEPTPALGDSQFTLDPIGWAGQWHQVTAVGTNSQTNFYVDGN